MVRMQDFQEILSKRQESNQDGPFEMFGGSFSSLRHAMAEYELERFYYNKAVTSEKYFYEALKNDGLTDEQIEKIVTEEKYVKFLNSNEKKLADEINKDEKD
jgi:hypothetical protein